MRVAQVNTFDIQGGAARAAWRLNLGLKKIGVESRFLVKEKASTDDSIVSIIPTNGTDEAKEEFFLRTVIQGQYINNNRTDVSNTLFSLPYPGYAITEIPLIRQADVINLHWVTNFLSSVTIGKLLSLGKPVVWTLHDQWPFTGGCHYSAGCTNYEVDCFSCPQLRDDPFGLTAALLNDKLQLFQKGSLTVVTPSHWLGSCARRSRLFKHCRVEVIPNSLETDVFKPVPKAVAKQTHGINSETLILLFGAETGAEKRKGFHELIQAVRYCLTTATFKRLVADKKVAIMTFGHPSAELADIGIPVVGLGYVNTDEQLKIAYSSADIFILPSSEDNLPNTMLEAMSCGTPVISFEVGGMPDVIKTGVTGMLAPPGDIEALGDAICQLLSNPELRNGMNENCRQLIQKEFTLETQARQYLNLYDDLLEHSPVTARSTESVETAFAASLNCEIGSSFKGQYDNVLLESLKGYTLNMEQKHRLALEKQAASYVGSWSWKITKPLRTLCGNFKR